MSMKLSICFFGFLLICGCSTVPAKNNGLGQFIEEKIIFRSEAKRPQWVYRIPASTVNRLWFIGLSSGMINDEQYARDEAMNNAIKKVVKFIGVDVMNKVEKVSSSINKSSQIVDPTVTRRSVERLVAKAFARRIKGKQWYIERCTRRYTGGSRSFYRVWVLAHVSRYEVNKAIKKQTVQQKRMQRIAVKALFFLNKAEVQLLSAERIRKIDPARCYALLIKAKRAIVRGRSMIIPHEEIRMKFLIDKIAILNKKIARIKKLNASDPEIILRTMLFSMVQGSSQKHFRVSIASATYDDTGIATPFSSLLINKVEEIGSSGKQLFRLLSNSDLRKNLQRKQASLDDLIRNPFLFGRYQKIDALLFLRFFKSSNGVKINFRLKQTGTANILKSGAFFIPRRTFSGTDFFYPNETDIKDARLLSPKSVTKNGLKIKVWPDKGRGATYKKGENVIFKIRVSTSCYVYIFSRNSLGKVSLLFPNKWDRDNYFIGGRLHNIPTRKMGSRLGTFAFPIQPPYGVDMIKVIASTRPIAGMHSCSNFNSVSDLFMTPAYRTRGIGVQGKVGYAEAMCSILTKE